MLRSVFLDKTRGEPVLISIVVALIIAKIKRLRLAPLLKAYPLYPFFFLELVFWFFTVNVFMENYNYNQYALYIQNAFIFVMILPIVVYKLYKPALVGSAFVLVGTGLNRLAMYVNGGKMPIYPTLTRYTGYFKPIIIEELLFH
jgi:hypothetical protein